MRKNILLVLAATLAACGGSDRTSDGREAAALEGATACSADLLSWATPTSTTARCAGPWEYTQNCWSSAPNINCPGSSYPTGKACSHAHARGTYTTNVAVVPVKRSVQECCYPNESNGFRCPKPPCVWNTQWDYQTPCTNAAIARRNKIPASNLDLRTPITYVARVTSSPGDGEAGTCEITFSNWPTSWHNAVDWTCWSSPIITEDHERPVLASCMLPETTVCGPTPDDTYVRSCGQVPNQLVAGCATGKVYSQSGISLEGLRNAAGADRLITAVCLTDEDQPLAAEGKDPVVLAQEKFARLKGRLDSAVGSGADSSLKAKLVQNLKLLFELKGDLLTAEQRQAALDLYLSEPVSEPACGSTWNVPLDPANGPVGALKLSHRMAQAHVPTAVVNAATSTHASAGHFVAKKVMAEVALWPAGPNRPLALSKASEGPVRVLERAFATLGAADAPTRRVLLQKNLWTLGIWFESARSSSAYGPEFFLSDLPYTEPVATWTPAARDRSTSGAVIKLAGSQYGKGFGAHADSELVFDLSGKGCSALMVDVGVDDDVGSSCPGSAAGFEIHADGVKVFGSVLKSAGQAPTPVALDIAGKTTIKLKATLGDGQNWCDHADWAMARVTCAAAPDQPRLWKDTSNLAGVIWKSLYGPSHESLSPISSPRDYKMAQLAVERDMVDALLADHQPIPAALGPAAPPLRKAPALFLLADALQALGDRLQPLASYHDLACRFLECASGGTRSELSSLYRLIGAAALDLPSATQPSAPNLRDELAAAEGGYNAESANYKSGLWTTYGALFARLKDRHSVVQDAVRDALGRGTTEAYDGAAWVLGASTVSPPPLVAFTGVVSEAAKKRENYLKTGLLLKETARALPVGLHADKMARIKADAEARARALGDAIGTFQGKRTEYVGTLIGEIDNKTNANDASARKAALAVRTYNLALDDAGLRIGASVDRERMAAHGRELGNALVGVLTQQGPAIGPFSVHGLDGRGPASGAFTQVTDVAISRLGTAGRVASGASGSVLNYAVTGSYTPSCALKSGSSFYGVPVNPAGGQASLADAEASSSGYSFAFSGGSYKAYKQENTRSKSGQACGGLDITVPIPTPIPGLSAMFGGSAKACASYSESRSWSKGNQSSSTATFAMGLRLPNTPFPDLPAAALLAVLVKPGSTLLTDVLDIQVLESQGAIAFARPADVYLVVNDLGCPDAPASKSLTVSMSMLVPATAMADRVGQAMKAVESYLWDVPVGGSASLGASYVAQGRLLPGQMSDLRSDALQKLRTACGSTCDTNTLPAAILGFYDLWVGQQILRIEREIELLSIRRELDALVLEAEAVDRDLQLLATKGRLADILPRWSLGNLEFANVNLRQATDALVEVVAEELYPMVALRYPEALRGPAFRALLGLDWVGEELGNVDTGAGLAGKVKTAVSETATLLDDAVRRSLADPNDVTTAYAVVRFPNPEKPPVSSIFPGKAADTARSIPLWASIKRYFTPGCARDPVTAQIVDPACQVRLDVRPDDLYGAGTTNGSLGCDLVAPVIKDMAFFLVTSAPDAGTRNAQNYLTPTRGERTMLFTLPGGIESWSFENEDYLQTPRTKLIYGKEQDWKTTFEAIPPTELSESVRGTSPFTGYTADSLQGAGDHWWNYAGGTWGAYSVQDFVVVMRVEGRKKAPGVRGVWSCP